MWERIFRDLEHQARRYRRPVKRSILRRLRAKLRGHDLRAAEAALRVYLAKR